MADTKSKEARSKNMSRIRNKNTGPEELVCKYLFSQGFRYRKNVSKLPGKPDIVLPKYKTVVFVNGCFWHGHSNCKYFVMPKSNVEFWQEKISRTIMRDNEVYEKLQPVIDNGIVLSATVDLRIPTTLVPDWSMTLDVKGLAFNEDKVQITASANDILNCEFPKLRYSALTFPGLKYLK